MVSLCAYAMGCAVAFGLSCTVTLDAGWAVTVAVDCATDSCDLGCNVGLSHGCSPWRDVFERRLPRYRPRRWHCRPWLFDQHAITWRVLVRRALTRVARTRRVAFARRALCTIAYSVQHVLTRHAECITTERRCMLVRCMPRIASGAPSCPVSGAARCASIRWCVARACRGAHALS